MDGHQTRPRLVDTHGVGATRRVDRRVVRRYAPVLVLAIVALTLGVIGPAAIARTACRTNSPNTDHDFIPDCWERRNGLVVGKRDQRTDRDHDHLTAIRSTRSTDALTGDGSIF